MTSIIRKAASFGDDGRKPPAKRQCREGEVTAESTSLSLLDLNDNCLVHMLSNLHFDDLNNVAMCCKQLCQLRAHESLNQTRTATLVCRRNSTPLSFRNSLEENDWREITGSRTHLRLDRIERVEDALLILVQDERRAFEQNETLMNVQTLDCSVARSLDQMIPVNTFHVLSWLLPNLQSVDLSNVKAMPGSLAAFCDNCPRLRRVTWARSDRSVHLDGFVLGRASNLAELYINDCRFGTLDFRRSDWRARRLLNRCNSLERVSLKDATYSFYHDPMMVHPISQEMLIEFVRSKTTLRWFRSDLSEENVAMLRSERPEVTFVSD